MKANTSASLYVLTALFLVLSVVFLSNRDSVSKLADSVGGQMAAISGSGSGLIGHWTFDSAGGSDSAGSNNANISGAGLVAGKIGSNALNLDGTDDYAALGDIPEADGGSAITVSAWVKSSKTTGVMYAVTKETSSAESWSLYWSSASGGFYGFNAFTNSGGNYARTGLGVLPNGSWHHIVGVYDGSKVKLYYDGNLQTAIQSPLTGTLKDTTLGVCVGTWSAGGGNCLPGSNAWQGGIDDVRIYNRALSSSEVGELYALGGTNVEVPPVVDPPVVVVPGAPTVSITSPANGATITSSPVTISANAAGGGSNQIAGVQFKVDGVNVEAEDTSSPYSRSWTTTGLTGSHTITAVARDGAGQTTSATVSVTVNTTGNTDPDVDPGTVTPAAHRTVNWTAPIGIPEPPFGIREDVTHFIMRNGETCQSNPEKCFDYGSGPEKYRLNAVGEPYTHYVDGSNLSNCDLANDRNVLTPLGTPTRPLCRLPLVIPAGSIVEVHGVVTYSNSSPANVETRGTAARPVFIRSTEQSKARIKNTWDINGTYTIVENLIFEDTDGDIDGDGTVDNLNIINSIDFTSILNAGTYGTIGIQPPSHHFAVRNIDQSSNISGGGIGAGRSPGDSRTLNNIVFYNNSIHNAGNFRAVEDGTPGADVGGISLGNIEYAWVVDNTCHHNGVECVWGGAGYLADESVGHQVSHHIYIGRNSTWENRQGGFWQKGGKHIVFSQNKVRTTYENRAGATGRGHGIGYQYGSEDVWFLFNDVSDTVLGLSAMNSGGINGGENVYAIGNVISNVYSNVPGELGYAMNLYGPQNRWVVGNTIYGAQSGINLLNGNNYIVNNIVSNITGPAGNARSTAIFYNAENNNTSALINNNLLHPSVAGGTVFGTNFSSLNREALNATNYADTNIEDDPNFKDASASNFALKSGSPAIDAGSAVMIEQLAERYRATYGVDIKKDFLGKTRPNGNGWDIGAYEYQGSGGPSNPTGIPERVVSWTAPVGVPEPPFGIREDVSHFILRAGETCSSDPEKCFNYGNGPEAYHLNPQGEPYTHWVNGEPGAGCTTFNNESLENHLAGGLGTPSAPLCRLPLNLPAGSIVEVHGLFPYAHNTATVQVYGTQKRPVFIRTTETDRANVVEPWQISGSYGIIENFLFRDADNNWANGGAAGNISLIGGDFGVVKFKSHHMSVRHNEISGNINSIGINATPSPIPGEPYDNYNVIWDNYVHHTGDVFSPVDKDTGGIKIAGKWLWAIDNKCHDNGNACVFTGGGNGDSVAPLNEHQYAFIARNNGYRNRESNFFVKQASHVVFSENISGTSFDLRGPGEMHKGGAMGYQYGPRDVWFINNQISDSASGITVGSDGVEVTENAYFIGNVIYNLHKNAADPTPQGAINIGGGRNHYILNNTIDDVDSGIYILPNGENYISGNIITNTNSAGGDYYGQMTLHAERGGLNPHISNNLIYQTVGVPRISFPEPRLTVELNALCGGRSGCESSGNINADPKFVDREARDYRLQQDSPARNSGNNAIIELVAQTYENTFGVSILKDISGNSRIVGGNIDIGAYEYGVGGGTNPSSYKLSVSKSGTGQGTVASAQGSINCGTTCEYTGSSGMTINLVATPTSESVFSGWSGACSGTGTTCAVNLTSNKTVFALFTFTCNGCDEPDESKPIINNIDTKRVTPKSAIISWDTNEPATSQIEYGTTIAYGNLSVAKTALEESHEITLPSLTPNTLYHYRVISRDASGNTQMSADRTFTTPKYGQGTRVVTTKVISAKGYNYSRDGITTPILPIGTMGTVVSDEKTTLSRSSSGWLVVFDKDSQDECNPTWADESDQICEGIIDWMRYFSEVLDWSGTAPVVQESYFTEYVAPIITPPVIINAGGTGVVSPGGRTNTGSSGGSSGGRSSVAPTPAAPSPVPAPAAISPAKPLAVGTAATTYSAVQAQAITKQLLKGSTGSEVLALQAALAKENLLKGTYIKGTFDNATEVALKSFQQKYFIVISGTPSTTGFGATGPKTRTKLNLILAKLPVTTQTISAPKASSSAVPATSAKPQITKQLSLGVKDAEVSILQAILVKEKLLTTYTKGTFDLATENAVKAFQKKHNIVSSGTVSTTGYGSTGPKTRAKLNQI